MFSAHARPTVIQYAAAWRCTVESAAITTNVSRTSAATTTTDDVTATSDDVTASANDVIVSPAAAAAAASYDSSRK